MASSAEHPVSFTTYPETLESVEIDLDATSTSDLQFKNNSATIALKDDEEAGLTFFVHFPPSGVTGTVLTDLKDRQQDISLFQNWLHKLAGDMVQSRVDKGTIGESDTLAKHNYRMKLVDYILVNKATWLKKTVDRNLSQVIRVEKKEFHAALLKLGLEGLGIPIPVYPCIEKVLQSIGDNIEKHQSDSEEADYWVLLTCYEYNQVTGTLKTIIRTIGFTATASAQIYISGKNNEGRTVNFKCEWSGAEYDFNHEDFRSFQTTNAEEFAENSIIDKWTTTIPI